MYAPSAPTFSSGSSINIVSDINDGAAREYLGAMHWSNGLQECLIKGMKQIPLRFFICDDSGSMMANDGSRLIQSGNKYSFVNCSRWEELRDSLKFHVKLIQSLNTTAEFRFLNGSGPIVISNSDPTTSNRLLELFDRSPGGGTPLCRHIREVTETIRSFEGVLRAAGQTACVVIATDGEASDGDVAEALRPLHNLPVWVVIKLCTNEDNIVNYWNNIDSQLELEMDILDDFREEAAEIYRFNKWFTYGLQLHRMREFGIRMKELDFIDEKRLEKNQVLPIVAAILGDRPDSYPHPEADFKGFLSHVNDKQKSIPQVWDPITQKLQPWIKVPVLAKEFGTSCSIM